MRFLLSLVETAFVFSVLPRPNDATGCCTGCWGWLGGWKPCNWLSKFTRKAIPRFINVKRNASGTTYKLFAITDMDNKAQIETYAWSAITRNGSLFLSHDHKKAGVEWNDKSDVNVTSYFSYKGRGMEMSDLVEFGGRMLAPDDKTGIIYEISGKKAIPWVILNSGPGNTTRGMKIEWLTLKDSLLYAGGHGTEYRDSNGTIVNKDSMWIKTITSKGEVEHINWEDEFTKIRDSVGYSAPGYLTHEAVQWSDYWQRWFFIPRKASTTVYDEKADETKGTNIIIAADPSFTTIEWIHIGKKPPNRNRGFSAFSFVPGTDDRIIVALKTKEVSKKPTRSWITVFDVFGNILMEDKELKGKYKFEGLYFV